MSKFVFGEGLTNSYDTWHGEDIFLYMVKRLLVLLGHQTRGETDAEDIIWSRAGLYT